jgi:hypothetical protein
MGARLHVPCPIKLGSPCNCKNRGPGLVQPHARAGPCAVVHSVDQHIRSFVLNPRISCPGVTRPL